MERTVAVRNAHMLFFFFLRFFFMWTFFYVELFKVFIAFVTILPLFYILVF